MSEMDELIGNITAISTANNTITVDIVSTGFTAFAFPTSAVAGAGGVGGGATLSGILFISWPPTSQLIV